MNGLRCRPGPKVPDFVDELPVTLLVEVLSPTVGELVLGLGVVNGDRAVLDQLLDEEKYLRAKRFARGE